MKFLVISSDDRTTHHIAAHCFASGHAFHSDKSGLIALSLPEKNEFDVIVVDDCAPYLQGLEVVRHLRRRNVRKPIVLLSQHASVGLRRVAEEAGADIFLAKPVTATEIEDNANAFLRPRPRAARTSRILLDELEIDLGARTVARGNRCIALSRTQIRLLWVLAERAGTVVPRENLCATIWKFSDDAVPRTLTAMVGQVRQRLAMLGADTAIVTVRRVGYMLRTKSDRSPTPLLEQ